MAFTYFYENWLMMMTGHVFKKHKKFNFFSFLGSFKIHNKRSYNKQKYFAAYDLMTAQLQSTLIRSIGIKRKA